MNRRCKLRARRQRPGGSNLLCPRALSSNISQGQAAGSPCQRPYAPIIRELAQVPSGHSVRPISHHSGSDQQVTSVGSPTRSSTRGRMTASKTPWLIGGAISVNTIKTARGRPYVQREQSVGLPAVGVSQPDQSLVEGVVGRERKISGGIGHHGQQHQSSDHAQQEHHTCGRPRQQQHRGEYGDRAKFIYPLGIPTNNRALAGAPAFRRIRTSPEAATLGCRRRRRAACRPNLMRGESAADARRPPQSALRRSPQEPALPRGQGGSDLLCRGRRVVVRGHAVDQDDVALDVPRAQRRDLLIGR